MFDMQIINVTLFCLTATPASALPFLEIFTGFTVLPCMPFAQFVGD